MTAGGSTEQRFRILESWIRSLPGLSAAELSLASGDASFRRYYRVSADGVSWIAMDAPPPMEDCRPFVSVAVWLRSMSLNAPEIIAGDVERGFLLMTDFGDVTYLQAIEADPASIDHLYRDAVDALLQMQARGTAFQAKLPPYDERLLSTELSLFRDWLCERHLGLAFGADEESSWRTVCGELVDNALTQPQVFVHRDYHSRNLMVVTGNNPGLIDFQDAVEGPLTYDLASLLKDCYLTLGAGRIGDLADRFYAGLDASLRDRLDPDAFLRRFELMGVQRHLKAAGIFARLLHRDGKGGYIADIPRTLRYIVDVAPRHATLAPLAALIVERCLPALESTP
jgi:aminoglycoside/choline kinase family phosphotransferase